MPSEAEEADLSINGKIALLADSLEEDLFIKESKNVKTVLPTNGSSSPNAFKVQSFPKKDSTTELVTLKEELSENSINKDKLRELESINTESEIDLLL